MTRATPPGDVPSSDAGIRAAATALRTATRTGVPCPPIRHRLGSGEIVDSMAIGYAVQDLLTRARLDEGARRVGRKIGLTSSAVQAQLGVDQPDFGVLFDDMHVGGTATVPIDSLLQPKIEAEIAFILGADLDIPDPTPAQARAAVASVVAAFEIVDSRITEWDITLVDTIADNASSGLFVLGTDPRPLGEDEDLRDVSMEMRDQDGTVVSHGTGAACLGDPINALVWLGRTAHRFGVPLRAGEIVLSGAVGPMVAVTPGATYTATFTRLGEVRAEFTPTRS